MIDELIKIFEQGYYILDGKKRLLKGNMSDYVHAICYLPDQIPKINGMVSRGINQSKKCRIYVSDEDCFEATIRMKKEGEAPIAVLNFSNPYKAGGAVRIHGNVAQEESLCMRSSLICSLESDMGKVYYNFQKEGPLFAATDAILLSPYVEIIKGEMCEFLESSYTCSVVSCAAPQSSPFSGCLEDYTKTEMMQLFVERIYGILSVLAQHEYAKVTLGAFGCGVYCNDPELVAQSFSEAFARIGVNSFFDEICFAIKCNDKKKKNYEVFGRYFGFRE